MSTADKLNYTKTNIDKLKSLTQKTVLSEVVTDIEQNYGNGSSGEGNIEDYMTENSTSNFTHILQKAFKKLPNSFFSFFDTSKITTLSSMLYDCTNLIEVDLSGFDTSNVTSMSSMCNGCESLITLDLSGFNTSNVTSLSGMFYNCKNLTEINLSSFDTSNVTNMGTMCRGCENLITIKRSIRFY